jgi:hypothetical protein
MTQYSATSTASSTPAGTASGGIDLKTLWITAASSAAAAYVTSKVWAAGTLAAAAFTPVLVAIIREALAKSTAVVTRVVPVKGVVRSARPDGSARAPDVAATGADWSAADLAAQPPAAPDDPALRVAQPGEISYHGSSSTRARHWRVAIVTGLLGFVIAAVAFTVPELVAGGSAAGGGRDTTIFGGKHRASPAPAVTTQTTTAPVKTVTTAPPGSVTVPAQTVTTPPPAVTTPAQPAPAATTTTPAPPVAEPPPAGVPPG